MMEGRNMAKSPLACWSRLSFDIHTIVYINHIYMRH